MWTISDPLLLRRIVQNLISNSVKFTDQGGVLIGAPRRNGHIRLEVWDTGPGIAAAHRDEIFEEFYQTDKDRDRERGLGLGLSIVRKLSELLGHSVEFLSREGRGTMFCIAVPDASEISRATDPGQGTAAG